MDEPAGVIKFVAKEGSADALARLLGEMAAVAAADDGCEIYAVHRSRPEPNTFFLYELYRDKDAMKVHMANTRLLELAGGLGALTDSSEAILGNRIGGDRAQRQ